MKKDKPRPKQIYLTRTKCDCMAQKHELINNCLNCGNIVCALEGEGNCLYCGKLVTRPEGLFLDDTTTYFPTLTPQQQEEAALQRSKAIMHKNKLVQRDKSTTQNNIFDQQLDYYEISENKWLDQEDRQHAIDRILAVGNHIETEQFKTNVKLDPLTGEFVREEFNFDHQGFKKEGKEYMKNKEMQEQVKKDQKAKQQKHNWDQRVLRSQKMRDLCQTLISDRKDEPRRQKDVQKVGKTDYGVTEIILED